MKKIKMIYGYSEATMQEAIDKWVNNVHPDIINCSICSTDDGAMYIAIIFQE